jgi:hypothetical protein
MGYFNDHRLDSQDFDVVESRRGLRAYVPMLEFESFDAESFGAFVARRGGYLVGEVLA